MKLPGRVSIVEMGPRDGLQNIHEQISTEDKVRLIDALSEAGVTAIESTSFVHPKAVPQMADAEEVMKRIKRWPGVRYSALVPNERGAKRAIDTGVDMVNCVISASDSHSLENVRMTTAEALEQFLRVATLVREASIPVQAIISTAFGCPFEGKVPEERVISLGQRLRDAGMERITLADTTGMANPLQVSRLVSRFAREVPGVEVATHFHNTRGMGLANIIAALEVGIDVFDASIGGLGGCPFAPGATGNVCTEDVVHMLAEMGIETGIDLLKLMETARFIQRVVGRDLPGQVIKAGRSYDLHQRRS